MDNHTASVDSFVFGALSGFFLSLFRSDCRSGLIEKHGDQDNDHHYDEDAEHTETHIFQVVYEHFRVETEVLE